LSSNTPLMLNRLLLFLLLLLLLLSTSEFAFTLRHALNSSECLFSTALLHGTIIYDPRFDTTDGTTTPDYVVEAVRVASPGTIRAMTPLTAAATRTVMTPVTGRARHHLVDLLRTVHQYTASLTSPSSSGSIRSHLLGPALSIGNVT